MATKTVAKTTTAKKTVAAKSAAKSTAKSTAKKATTTVAAVKITESDLKKINRWIVVTEELEDLIKKIREPHIGIPKNDLRQATKAMKARLQASMKLVEKISI